MIRNENDEKKKRKGRLWSQEGRLLPFVYELHCLPNDVAGDLEAARAELVDGVLRCVMEDVVVAVVDVDDVGHGDAVLHEGKVVVANACSLSEKMRLIAEPCGGFQHKILQPGRGVGVTLDVEIGVANHVGEEEGFDLLERAILFPNFSEMARAVKAIGGGPCADGFFSIGPEQPDAIAFELGSAQMLGEFQKQSRGGSAIVGSDEGGLAERVVGVVVAGDDDDAIFLAGKLRDNVSSRKASFGTLDCESVVDHLIVLQARVEILFDLPVPGAAQIPRAVGDDFFGV